MTKTIKQGFSFIIFGGLVILLIANLFPPYINYMKQTTTPRF